MTNLFEIKNKIRDFVAEQLGENFNAVYWANERLNEPQKPYCMLTELAESDTHREAYYTTAHLEKTLEEYKQVVFTIGVYVDGLDEYDEKKEFAYNQIDKLKANIRIGAREFIFGSIAIKNISGIRPLHEEVDGGYLFRYEFDITIGYNEQTVHQFYLDNSIEIEIDEKFDTLGEVLNPDGGYTEEELINAQETMKIYRYITKDDE